tara:strand:+ start:808 stop:1227 length:420 start_codon:yes stop_codon:yes gene_type:complete
MNFGYYKCDMDTGEITKVADRITKENVEKIAALFGKSRRVALDFVEFEHPELGPFKIEISTVFLVLDHSWEDGPPLLFETMVFCDSDHEKLRSLRWADIDMQRYATLEEAREGHAQMVDFVRDLEIPPIDLLLLSSDQD